METKKKYREITADEVMQKVVDGMITQQDVDASVNVMVSHMKLNIIKAGPGVWRDHSVLTVIPMPIPTLAFNAMLDSLDTKGSDLTPQDKQSVIISTLYELFTQGLFAYALDRDAIEDDRQIVREYGRHMIAKLGLEEKKYDA